MTGRASAEDVAWLRARSRPARAGILAYITDGEAVDWQSSIDIVLRAASRSTTTLRERSACDRTPSG